MSVLLSIVTDFMSLICFLSPANIRKYQKAYQNLTKDLRCGFCGKKTFFHNVMLQMVSKLIREKYSRE